MIRVLREISALMICVGLAVSGRAQAQQVGVTLGASYTQVRERALNDIVHDGAFAGPLEIRLDLVGPRIRHTVELSGRFALLSSRYEAEAATVQVGLELGWRPTWTIEQPVETLSVAVGPSLSAGTLFAVFPSWDESHGYYLTAYAAGVATRLEARLPKRWSLSLELSAPLLAVVARPESPVTRKADDPAKVLAHVHHNAHVTSVHAYQGVDLDLGLGMPGTRGFAPALVYQLRYQHADIGGSRPVEVLVHGLALRGTFGRAPALEDSP